MNEMSKVLFASVVGSLMYVMVRIKLNIAHTVGVIGQFLTIHGKEH